MKYESHAGIYYSFIHEMAKLSTDLCQCNNVESFHLRKPETPNYSQRDFVHAFVVLIILHSV